MMKKVIAWLLVLALTVTVSIGATLAYLTDTDEDVNVMTLGKVKIDQLEYERIDTETENEEAKVQEFHDNKPLIPAVTKDGFDYTPGDTYVDWEQIGKDGYTSEIWNPENINNEVDKMVFIKNKGDYDAYVRSVFAFEAGKYTTLAEFNKMVHLNLNTTDYTWEWVETPVTIGESTYFVATATYNKVLAPGALTEISLSQIALDKTATNADVEAFGETYQILVKSQGIQADGFADADTALNEGFGVIDANTVPWENDSAIKGATIYNALHYVNADTTGTDIVKQVKNITFGLNKEYAAIVAENKGTLVDVEQDVPVYAYYVPNGSNYDVYLLADDTIYAPADCSNLCNGMSALETVDTSNLDVSRTTSMYRMFRDCEKLAEIDVSNWNTANVTNMWDLFRACKSLPSVDVSNWETGKVETMIATFQDCVLMKEIDVSNWDTSNVTDMTQTFNRCKALTTLDVSKWDTSKVTSMQLMFNECLVLPSLDVSKWDVSNVTHMQFMFKCCFSLETLDVSEWDTGNCVYFNSIFSGTKSTKMKIHDLDVTNWDMGSAETIGYMFYGNKNLISIDMSKWDVSKVVSMDHMFCDCINLESINMSNWDTSSLETMDGVFNDCNKLKTIDVSSLDTAKVKEFSQVFEYCNSLEEIIGLENWDTSSGQDYAEIFYGCSSLKKLNLSSFDTRPANKDYLYHGQYENEMLWRFLSGCTALEEITFGPYFSFDGDGSVPKDEYRFHMSASTAVEGWDGYWYDAEGNAYAPADILEETARTYYAVKPVTP